MIFYKKRLVYFSVIQYLSDSVCDLVLLSSSLRKNCDQYFFFIFFRARLYVFRVYLNFSRSPPRFPYAFEILSRVFLIFFTFLFYYFFKYIVIRTIFIFLSNILISRSFSQITFFSKSFFEYFRGRYGLFSLIDFYFSATVSSLSLSLIRF